MENQKEFANVIPLKPHFAIFNTQTKERLTRAITPLTDKPDEVVSTVEQVLCTHIVAALRQAANNIVNKIVSGITGGKN